MIKIKNLPIIFPFSYLKPKYSKLNLKWVLNDRDEG